MSLMRYAGAGALVFVLASAPLTIVKADAVLDISGQAQLVCSAGISAPTSPSPPSAATIDLGQLNEFCNDPEGYDVWIDYPSSLDSATLIVNGAPVTLSSAGTVQISHSDGAGQTAVTLALSGASISGSVPLTVRMIPTNPSDFAVASLR